MEFNQIPVAILTIVVIGIVLGVGIILLDEFGNAVKASKSITNESIAIASGTGNTANDDVTSLAYFGNTSGAGSKFSTDDSYGINIEVNWSEGGVITVGGNYSDASYSISYVFDEDEDATTVVHSARDGTDDFVTWIPVIIILIAMAIILGLIVKGFKQ